MPRRTVKALLAITIVSLACLFLLSTSSRPAVTDTTSTAPVPTTKRYNSTHDVEPQVDIPWYQADEKPPEQRDSSNGDIKWHTDTKWLHPFSSSMTLDEQRAVIPPAAPRVPVYAYLNTSAGKSEEQRDADQALLQLWKRAWWAQGFEPAVLTQTEALENPRFQQLQAQRLPAELETELTRWLAWENMGSGLLASIDCVPMTGFDDPLLVRLRHGAFKSVTRFAEVGTGLFAGNKAHVTDFLTKALESQQSEGLHEISQILASDQIMTESANSIAHYSLETVHSKYRRLSKLLATDPVQGTREKIELINFHLHNTWQEPFIHGIAVLQPHPAHTTKLIEPGIHLARLLSECSKTELPTSCPPNRPNCQPCVIAKRAVRTVESIRNISTQFVVATIPHPFTSMSLNNLNSSVGLAQIRRDTERDSWLRTATRAFLGDGRAGPSRLVAMKDIIVSERFHDRGLWLTVETFPAGVAAPPSRPKGPTADPYPEEEEPKRIDFPKQWLEELDWHFGFIVPRILRGDGQSRSPVPGTKPLPKDIDRPKSSYNPRPATFEEQQFEIDVLEEARRVAADPEIQSQPLRRAVEAWNLADTEIWKFARAYWAQSVLERKQWEEKEAKLFASASAEVEEDLVETDA